MPTKICEHCGARFSYNTARGITKNQKYCTAYCRIENRKKNGYYNKKQKNRLNKKCILCKKNIYKVGKRKGMRKFCSNRCMLLHRRIKVGQKYVMVKIPVQSYIDMIRGTGST